MISHNLQGVAFYHVTQDLLTNQLLLGNAQDTPAKLRLVTERELTNVEHLAGVHLHCMSESPCPLSQPAGGVARVKGCGKGGGD